MKIGVPREIKPQENRVSLTPAYAKILTARRHQVFVERGAGEGSGFRDEEYLSAGAELSEGPLGVWAEAEMIVKVKEPVEPEFQWMRAGQILFTFLHLAADRGLTESLLERKVVSIGYETVQLPDGTLPLLAPMSEVAGTLAVQTGALCLEAKSGGKGILLSGITGLKPAAVMVIGGGLPGGPRPEPPWGSGRR